MDAVTGQSEPFEFVQNVLNFLFDMLMEADLRTRNSCEGDVKGEQAQRNGHLVTVQKQSKVRG